MPRLTRDGQADGKDTGRVVMRGKTTTSKRKTLAEELGSEVVVPEVVSTAIATPDHRPNVYVEPLPLDMGGVPDDITGVVGRVVYRMSALGSCRKSLVACRLGIDGETASDQMQVYYDEGTNAEAGILQTVFGGKAGNGGCPGGLWKLLDPEDRQSYRTSRTGTGRYPHCRYEDADEAGTGQFTVLLPLGKGRIGKGHLDGIAELYSSIKGEWENGQRAVVEVKHLAPKSFDKFLKYGVGALDDFPYYKYQISGYMLGTGLPALYVVAEKLTEGSGDERRYLGVGRITVVYIPDPPLGMGKLRSQVAYVEKQAGKGELGACDIEMYPCPVWFLHDGETGDRQSRGTKPDATRTTDGSSDAQPHTVPDEWEADFISAVGDYNRGLRMEKEAKRLKDEGKKVMAVVVEAAGIGEGEGGVLRSKVGDVTWVNEEVEGGIVERKGYRKVYPKIGKNWVGEKEEGDGDE